MQESQILAILHSYFLSHVPLGCSQLEGDIFDSFILLTEFNKEKLYASSNLLTHVNIVLKSEQ